MAKTANVDVADLLGPALADLHLEIVCGEENLSRQITHPRVQKPGLAFAGHYDYIRSGRVQIIGASEVEFLDTLSASVRRERFDHITQLDIPVFVISKGLEVPELVERCRLQGRPVLSSPDLTSKIIRQLSFFLEDHLVPHTQEHAVLLEIYGLGVLLIGKSGVGKSESALDLITRGHSLVADDRVTIRLYPRGELIGFGGEGSRHHMELRGLGIINVKDLFGLAAVRERKSIDLVVRLERWEKGKAYDRLGLDESVYHILETPVPYLEMPVATGRNVAILVEVAARNHVLKMQGHHSAWEFVSKLEAELERKRRP